VSEKQSVSIVAERKYIHLLVVLVVFFLLFPFVGRIKEGFHIIASLFFIAIVLTLHALNLNKRVFFWNVTVGCVALVLGFLSFFFANYEVRSILIAVSLCIFALFMIAAIALMIRKMFLTSKVTVDVMRGGIAVYFLLGYLWTLFYFLIHHFDAHAFSAVAGWSDSCLFYFSFATLTTLGYGDILPINRFAMVLANLEAIVGQLYIAIFVARLVGMHIVHQVNYKSNAE
jgi:hypothetical protein